MRTPTTRSEKCNTTRKKINIPGWANEKGKRRNEQRKRRERSARKKSSVRGGTNVRKEASVPRKRAKLVLLTKNPLVSPWLPSGVLLSVIIY